MSGWALLRRLWPFLRRDRWAFLVAVSLTPATAALTLVQPYLLKRAIDQHLLPGLSASVPLAEAVHGLIGVALLYLGAVVLGYLLDGAYTLVLAWGGQRTLVRIRSAVYRHVLNLRQSFLDRQPAGRLLTRATSDVDALGEAFSSGVINIILDLLLVVGTLVAMLVLDARLTGVLLLLAPPLLTILEVVRRRLRVLFGEVREALASVNAFLSERVDGVEVVQLFNHEAASERRFDVRNEHFRRVTTRSNVYDSFMYALVDGTASIGVAVMLWYGSGLAAKVGMPVSSAVTVGLMVAFIQYLDQLFTPLRELSSQIAVLQRGAAAVEKIFGLLDEREVLEEGGEPISEIRGHLVLRDVWFRYHPESEDVLRGVDVEVRPGEVVAIVGATGAGKTTLTRLLDTSYTGYRGSITIDGKELSTLSERDVRHHVAGVRQDPQLFSETVRFNVDLGNRAISAAAAETAAERVHADRVVDRVGWEHVLRERGADLSVGEGQLMTFARAMAHDPAVVILDEATASIDSLTEQLIQDALGHIFTSKTVIVVAHRLSTVKRADRIVVMEGGRNIEEGTHSELMAADGAYARLVRSGEELLAA